ncbi:HTH domain-containing protein [Halococcus hamelinensis]|uniref:Transcriptional regulator n=1 Tax=Halococcus hamelinensis 100A6 TaxID=1132509 RepID=M0LVR7_9EURY|nr:HTH domain-containing protein [Halococcus hamelinensis]EMA36454.1 transcriptional regulator [Halococcus hamelinensis 100A6]
MSSIELTESQKTILQELVDLYRDTEDAVKGETIAEQIDRNPGTIRNQMQSLKALQLVEGVPGPKGGYKPTANAYNALDIEEMDEAESVPLGHNGNPIEEQVIQEINLMSVHHPEKCRAEIRLQGSVRDFHEGDSITVGPTPKSNLAITGTIDGVVNADNKLIINTETMEAPVDQ